MRVAFVRSSKNRKTGPIPISMSPKITCPSSCPLRGNGCYAEHGPLGWQWDRLSSGETGISWRAFLQAVRRLPEHAALEAQRQRGSSRQRREDQPKDARRSSSSANTGKRGFTYSHKHATEDNLAAIRAANRTGFTINLSANTLEEADTLARKKAGPGGRDPAGRFRVPPRRAHARRPESDHLPRELPERPPVHQLRPLRRSDAHRNHRVSGPRAGIQKSRARRARNEVKPARAALSSRFNPHIHPPRE